ncbi:alanyl-tRNA editing protein [Oscillospiraceae bacterium LTW-04]|nr:alanyl-tRNA editing protein [Oscillospiraceae bacterium MB24-C1]
MLEKRLFRENPYQIEFSATVLSCVPQGEHFAVALDATCFYPEGGGQPADTGMLGNVKVLDVHERDEDILHTTDAPLTVGETVIGKIDWLKRFSLMQHHTGEHIVSGIVHKLFKLDNVGFHMGSAMVTVDFNGELSAEQLATVELAANRIVFANIPVQEYYPDASALTALNYRSKKALFGKVRIITVPDADCCACCGTHVAKTGEIGLIKLLSPQRYKGGTRVGMLCGERALTDYRQKDASVADISHMLSAKPIEVSKAVQRILSEADALRAELVAAKDKLFTVRLESVDRGDGLLCLFEDNLTPNELRRFCMQLIDHRSGPCLLLCGDDENGYRYALGVAQGDARTLSKELHQTLGGKGGGNAQVVQGTIATDHTRIAEYVAMKQVF